jgi:hypothetical protein
MASDDERIRRMTIPEGIKFKPGSFGAHEALHTAGIILNLTNEHLMQHPTISNRPEWLALAEAAHKALFDLHQSLGAEHLTAQQDEMWERAKLMALKNSAEMTDEEDAQITADALADPDAQPSDDLMLRQKGRRWVDIK